MSAREVVEMVYTPQNMYEILRYLCSNAYHLAKAIDSFCRPYGIPFPEPSAELMELEIPADRCEFAVQKSYPIGFKIVSSRPYRWYTFITVNPYEFDCAPNTVCHALAPLGYRTESYDLLLEWVRKYVDWLRTQVELINQQIDHLCHNRVNSENHKRFLELLESARIFNSVDTE